MDAISREEKGLSPEYKAVRKDQETSKMVDNMHGRVEQCVKFTWGYER
jgi:hypothetical protein